VSTRPDLLRQLPAVLLAASHIDEWALTVGTQALLRVGNQEVSVWIHKFENSVLDTDQMDRSPTVLVDNRTATRLGVVSGQVEKGQLQAVSRNLRIQPMRLDYPLESSRAVVGEQVLSVFGGAGSYALIRTTSRCMPVLLSLAPNGNFQSEERIRLSYHARLLLGIGNSDASDRPIVSVHAVPVAEPQKGRSITRLRTMPGRIVERIGGWMLGAPAGAFAVLSSSSSDDPMRVARCSRASMDLLGIEPGDRVLVGWLGRVKSVRVHLREASTAFLESGPEVVAWNGSPNDALSDDLTIALPAVLRAELGVPRDGVVELRRSVGWLLRKRAVGLTLPLVALAVSVPGLGMNVWAAGGLLAMTVVMTLAQDRIPAVRPVARIEGQ
jgi:hypothetical protein